MSKNIDFYLDNRGTVGVVSLRYSCCKFGGNAAVKDDTIVCDKCGKPLNFKSGNRRSTNLFAQDPTETRNDKKTMALESTIDKLKADLSEAKAALDEVKSQYKDRVAEVEQKSKEIDASSSVISTLETSVADLERKLDLEKETDRSRVEELEKVRAESKELHAELDNCKKQLVGLSQQYDELKGINADLKQENSHLRNNVDQLSTIDFGEVTEHFLEYIMWVYNASIDRDDAEALRSGIRRKTETTIDRLDGEGLSIQLFDRGTRLESESLNYRVKTVSDRILDKKVDKMTKIGCTFKDNVYPPIRGEVWICDYRPTAIPITQVDTVKICKPFETPPSEKSPRLIAPTYGENTQTTLDPGQVVTVEGKAVPNRTYEPETPKEPVTEGELNLEEIKVQETRLAYRETPPEQQE